MFVYSNTSSTLNPGLSSSTSNTSDPTNISFNSSSSLLRHQLQQSSSSLFSIQQPQQKQVKGCTSSTPCYRPPSHSPILDSPTLAREERARLRLEAATPQQNLNESCSSNINTLNGKNSLERAILDSNKQFVITGRLPVSSMTGPIKRGLLWQQRDRLFSRWKERYFVLTRDYLHCFKRASGSANERASDMGQFIFKVKLVDVEKVEWLNRRSYSAIGLLLGREGRVLLRCDEGLGDWFEILEECTLTSKERRKALKIAQGPRSRASLAAPISHVSLQNNHFGLGGTFSSALDDWLMTNGSVIGGLKSQKLVTNSMCGYEGTNPFLFSDSVPDLSVFNTENHNHISGFSTNHSTPQKVPYLANNHSRHSNICTLKNSSSNCNGSFASPCRTLISSSFGLTHVFDEEIEDNEVELRRPQVLRRLSTENGNISDRDWLYRKPNAPTDMRHSVQPIVPAHNNTSLNKLILDLDCSAHDSGLDTPSSTHRPSSYREQPRNKCNVGISSRDSIETSVSSSQRTNLNSSGSLRSKQIPIHMQNASILNKSNDLHASFNSIHHRVLKIRNKEFSNPIKATNQLNHNEIYDPNQNRDSKNGNQSVNTVTTQSSPIKMQHLHSYNHQMHLHFQAAKCNGNDNTGNNNNGNIQNSSIIFRERYQHPVLAAIINETKAIQFKDRSFSECQQMSPKRSVNSNLSLSTSKRNQADSILSASTIV